jgi:hypothetical protein
MGSFLSDTFFKSFSNKYVYVEAATTYTAAPSHVSLLYILYNVHVHTLKCIGGQNYFIK